MSNIDTLLLGYLVVHFGVPDLILVKRKIHRKLARILRQHTRK